MSKHQTATKIPTIPIIILLCMLLLISLSINVLVLINWQKSLTNGSPAQISSVGKKCLGYGFIKKEEFLTHYTTKKNETLQSIAQNQLHEGTRSHELFFLNQDLLQNASISETAMLPENTKILVPPVEARFTSANILGLKGQITKIEANQYFISPESGLTITVYADSDTKLERKFKTGDCVEAIYYGDNSNKAVWIFPQT